MKIETFAESSLAEIQEKIQLILDRGKEIKEQYWQVVVIDGKPFHYIIIYYV